jgi:CheY-like chemotaxis protein
MLAVRDSGAGMDEPTRERIFEPFFTTKSVGQGTGLGLSTVYGIVKQSSGGISVDSAVGRGCTFRIYLPRADAAADRGLPSRDATVREGNETILIVEDEETVQCLAERVLASAGYRVLVAANGTEALRWLERHDGPIDLVITNVIMSGMSGPDLADRLVKTHGRMKVLYTSGFTNDATGVLKAGAHVVSKPYSITELMRKVRDVLDSPERRVVVR